MSEYLTSILNSVQTKKGKVLTKGAKQIREENVSTLSFYMYMAIGAMAIHFAVTMMLFEFTTLIIVSQSNDKQQSAAIKKFLNGMRWVIVTESNSVFCNCIYRKLSIHVVYGSRHVFGNWSAPGPWC